MIVLGVLLLAGLLLMFGVLGYALCACGGRDDELVARSRSLEDELADARFDWPTP